MADGHTVPRPILESIPTHMLKILCVATLTAGLVQTSLRAADNSPDPRLFELRTYHAQPGKLEALLARFRDHTTRLFAKHGMTNIGYWQPADNPDRLIIYLLAYPDRAARDASWKNFSADADWQTVAATSEADGKLVATVEQRFLTATAYSPGFGAVVVSPGRLFEMRTYTTTAGNLTALHQRFRDHTLELFRHHGMTNLGHFQPVAGQPAAEQTLLYFIVHRDAAAARASWAAFRSDPVWLSAKQASESAAGGSLTVPDGVKSLYLKATDFSPAQ